MMEEVDKDGTGEIDFEEFKLLMEMEKNKADRIKKEKEAKKASRKGRELTPEEREEAELRVVRVANVYWLTSVSVTLT